MSVYAEDLTVGTRYLVEQADCCNACTFTAVLTEKRFDPDLAALIFDNGVTITEWDQTDFTEAPQLHIQMRHDLTEAETQRLVEQFREAQRTGKVTILTDDEPQGQAR